MQCFNQIFQNASMYIDFGIILSMMVYNLHSCYYRDDLLCGRQVNLELGGEAEVLVVVRAPASALESQQFGGNF